MLHRRCVLAAPFIAELPTKAAVARPAVLAAPSLPSELRGNVAESAAAFLHASRLGQVSGNDTAGHISTYLVNEHSSPLNFAWSWKGGRIFRTALSPLLQGERESRLYFAQRPEVDHSASIQYTPLRRMQRASVFVDSFNFGGPPPSRFSLFHEQRSPIQMPSGERQFLRIGFGVSLDADGISYRIDRENASSLSIGFTGIGGWSEDATRFTISQLQEQRVEVQLGVFSRFVARSTVVEYFGEAAADRAVLLMRGGGLTMEGSLTRLTLRLPRPPIAPTIEMGDLAVIGAGAELLMGGTYQTLGFNRW